MVFNLADETYNSSGYALLDRQTFQSVRFLFPAQGRSLQAGVELTF
jgi:hypothetical protein